jgi:hypothetical protein
VTNRHTALIKQSDLRACSVTERIVAADIDSLFRQLGKVIGPLIVPNCSYAVPEQFEPNVMIETDRSASSMCNDISVGTFIMKDILEDPFLKTLPSLRKIYLNAVVRWVELRTRYSQPKRQWHHSRRSYFFLYSQATVNILSLEYAISSKFI